MRKFFLLCAILLLPLFAVESQEDKNASLASLSGGEATVSDVHGSLNWQKLFLDAAVAINLSNYHVSYPCDRLIAEELLAGEYFSQIRNHLLYIPIDSNFTLGDSIAQGVFRPVELDEIIFRVKRYPAVFSADFGRLSSAYSMDLKSLAGLLVVDTDEPTPVRHSLDATYSGTYTGVVIFADSLLPVHGAKSKTLAVPCLFPKIYDSDMRLVYSKDNVQYDKSGLFEMVYYATSADVLQNTPSGMSPEYEKAVGKTPLRIFAREVFGVRPSDLVISNEDAAQLLSNDTNRGLLRAGKVIIVVNKTVICSEF